LAGLGNQLGLSFEPRRIDLEAGVWVTVDGASDDAPILVEAWDTKGSDGTLLVALG